MVISSIWDVAHAEVAQAVGAGLSAGGILVCGGTGGRTGGALVGGEIASLHGQEVRRVNHGQVLILFDVIANGVVLSPFHVAIGAHRHFENARIIGGDFAEGADGAGSRIFFDRGELNSVDLLGGGIDAEAVGSRIGGYQGLADAIGVDGHQVHTAVGSRAGLIGMIGRMHGIDIIKNSMGSRRGPLIEVADSETDK